MTTFTITADDVRTPEDAVEKFLVLAQVFQRMAASTDQWRSNHLAQGMTSGDLPVMLLSDRLDYETQLANRFHLLSARFQDHIDRLAALRRNSAMANTQRGGYAARPV